MAPGRKQKNLGNDCLSHPEASDKVSCLVCQGVKTSEGDRQWIGRRSWAKHIIGKIHLDKVAEHEIQEHAQVEARIRPLEDPYNASPAALPSLEYSHRSEHQLPESSCSVNDPGAVDANGVAAGDFQFTEEEQEAYFPAPIDEIAELEAAQDRLRAQFETLRLQALEEELDGQAEDATEPASLRQAYQSEQAYGGDEGDEQDLAAYLSGIPADRRYPPYGSKTMFLLHCTFNIPRMRMSLSQRRLLLWVLRECGVKDVPSLRAYQELEQLLRQQVGVPTSLHKSDLGNVFYSNSVLALVCKDLSHPDLARNIAIYPDESERPLTDFFQASYLKDSPRSELTPSYYTNGKHFFVDELCRLRDKRFFIPKIWVTRNGDVYAWGPLISCDTPARGPLQSPESSEVLIKGEKLEANVIELTDICLPPLIGMPDYIYNLVCHADCFADDLGATVKAVPSPERKVAEGDDLIVICTPLFCDDVSGARSKQYQKHINIYTANWNLPSQFLQQESSVRFVSTSPTASGCEQFVPVLDIVKDSRANPMRCYNAWTHRFCRVRLRVPCLPGDNPQQSEESSHAGVNANCKCRRCKKGGTADIRESDEGYHALYSCGEPRTVRETRDNVETQIGLACLGVDKPIAAEQTLTGVKDKVACYWIDKLIVRSRLLKSRQPRISAEELTADGMGWLRSQTTLPMNPLLDVPYLDPHRDTPVEILHTWLLGVVKYIWHEMHSSWTDAQRSVFVMRLQDTDIDGLNIPPLRAAYMMQYHNGLIGKHFKSLAQTMGSKTYGLTTPNQAILIRAMGEMTAALWITEIDDMKQHLADLQILTDNVLDAFANIDPARIIVKEKLQVLPHILEDIPRFGPPPRYSTETYECFNAVFRLSSVHSNHQAPSRDIAVKMSEIDCVRHIVTGGFWEDSDTNWVCAGSEVLSAFRDSPLLQHHFGWVLKASSPTPGRIQLLPQRRRVLKKTEDTSASGLSVRRPTSFSMNAIWSTGVSVIASSGDICHAGSWVIFKDNGRPEDENGIGRIEELLVQDDSEGDCAAGSSFVVMEQFLLGSVRHPTLGFPVLRPPQPNTKTFEVVKSTAILFLINVQHDCEAARCSATGTRIVRQERQETVLQEAAIEHNSSSRYYLINTHALHNAASLRRHLPRSLFAPQSLYSDRLKRHQELAARLRVTEAAKRVATQKKRKETVQKKAQKKADATGASQHASGSGVDNTTRASIAIHLTPGAAAATDVQNATPAEEPSRGETDELGDETAPTVVVGPSSRPGLGVYTPAASQLSGGKAAATRSTGTKRKRVE